VPSNPREVFHREILGHYDEWMQGFLRLVSGTRCDRCAEASRFLVWLGERGSNQQNLLKIMITDVDAYMTFRSESQRRNSLQFLATNVRSFLRHLHYAGRIATNLSTAVMGPTLYAFESIPSSLRPEDVKAAVETTRKDHSQSGLRDYAILMLLSSYGLRAGEITSLRLEDVDWRSDVLRVYHSKTGVHSELPLLPSVGNAILDYLRKGHPKTQAREIFLISHAPYRPFKSGSCLYWPVRHRLAAAGVNPAGKRGPHAFRHARAVSMLRAAVSPKGIGDILGHQSARSTTTYLKLATEDLRAVALEIPGEVSA
jgi:site-specific recombinase XerD